MVAAAVEPLTLSTDGFLAGGPGHITPIGNLQSEVIKTVQIAHISLAASTKFPLQGHAQQQRQQLGQLALSAITAGLGGVRHCPQFTGR